MIGFKTKFMTRISTIEVELQSGLRTQGTMHATVFSPRPEDEVLGLYRDQRFQGEAWGLRCSYGPGSVYVLGSEITDEARRQLYAHILDREGIARIPLPPRVSCCPQKTADGRRAWALSNWDEKPHTIALPQPGQNLLTNTALSDEVILEPFSNAFVAFSA
jgi:beta-galactosidase GanA